MNPALAPWRVTLDEGIDVLPAPLLTARGMEVLAAVGAGYPGWGDEAQLVFAAKNSRVLVSHNRADFEALAVLWWSRQQDHAGVVLAVRRASPYDLLRHVLPVLARYDQGGWRNVVMNA